MLFVLALAVLVLAIAVVILFAMLGQLAGRVPEPEQRVPFLKSLPEIPLGGVPGEWPPGLPGRQECTLIVLSTICRSCADIAQQLSAEPGYADRPDVGLVIATGARAGGGEEFVERHSLQRFRYFIDEHGDWVSAQFDLRFSPAALVLRGGRLESAYSFNDVAALLVRVGEEKKRQEEVRT